MQHERVNAELQHSLREQQTNANVERQLQAAREQVSDVERELERIQHEQYQRQVEVCL